MAGMGLLDTTNEALATEDDEDETTSSESEGNRPTYIVTGQLNQGRRIDYVSGPDKLSSVFSIFCLARARSFDVCYTDASRTGNRARKRVCRSPGRPQFVLGRKGLELVYRPSDILE